MKFIMSEKENPITDNQEKIARYGKALSNPIRIFILEYLADNLNKCCYSGDMAEILPIARSTLSEHLKELKKCGSDSGRNQSTIYKILYQYQKLGRGKTIVCQIL